MAFKVLNRMAILDSNRLLYGSGLTYSWVATNFTTATGFGTTMLQDDDATTQMKSATVPDVPSLEVVFGSSQALTAFGICNHNVSSAGYQYIAVQYYTSSWQGIGTYTLPTYGISSAAVNPDRDVLLVFDSVSATRFRFTLIGSGPYNMFNIGYVYWGNYYEVTTNPVNGQFLETRRSTTRYAQSIGGQSHAVKGMTYRPGDLEMQFMSQSAADLKRLQGSHRTENIIGILPPEAAPDASLGPSGIDNFWGRVDTIQAAATTPSNITVGNVKYNTTITMRGAL